MFLACPASGEHSSCAMPAVELPPPHLPPRVPGALRRIPPRLHTPGHCTAAPQHLRSTSSTAGHQPAAHRPGTDVEQKMGDLSHGLRSPRLRRSTAVGCVRAQKLCATSSAPADCGGAGVRVCIWAPEHAEQDVRGHSSSGHTDRWRRRRRQDAGSRVLVRPGVNLDQHMPIHRRSHISKWAAGTTRTEETGRRDIYCVGWLTRVRLRHNGSSFCNTAFG